MRIDRRTALGLFGSAIAFPLIARAQDSLAPNTIVKVGNMFRLDTNQAGSQIGPRLAPLLDGSGGFLATWTNRTPQTVFKEYVCARYFNATSHPTSGNIRVRGDGNGHNNPPVAFPDGSAMVFYYADTTDDGLNIFAQRLAANHVVSGAPKLISAAATPRNHTNPLVARLANNTVAAAWSNGAGDVNRDCRGRIVDANGNPKSAEKLLPAETADDQDEASIVALPTNAFVFAYQTKAGTARQTKVQRYNSIGSRVGTPFLIYADAIARRPGLAALPDGGYAVFWTDYTNTDQGILKGRLFSKLGVAKPVFTGAANGVSNDTDGNPLVALTTDGRMLVISRAVAYSFNPFQTNTRILASLYSAAGQLLTGPLELYFNSGVAGSPGATEPGGLIRLDDGTFVAAWSGAGPSFSNMHAFAMRLKVT